MSKWVSETLVSSNSIGVWPKHGQEEPPTAMTSMKTFRSSRGDAGPKERNGKTIWMMSRNGRTILVQKTPREDESFGNKPKERALVIDMAHSRTLAKRIGKRTKKPGSNIKKKSLRNSMTFSNLATLTNMTLREMILVGQITRLT